MKWSHRLAYRLMRAWWFVRRPTTSGARVLLIKDGQVLLVRHTYLRSWMPPGGGVAHGETLEQAVRREAREEVGATLHHLRLHGVYNAFGEHKHDTVALFVSEDFETDGTTDREIEEARLFPLDDLPEGISPATRRRIREYLEGEGPYHGVW